MRRSFGLATGIAALSLLLAPSPASASHSWSNYHWGRTSNPFTVTLGDNVSTGWDGHLNTASTDWGASSVLNTNVGAGGSSPATCDPTPGRVEVCNSTYGSNGWLGLATIWLSGGHISQGTAKMNDTYFNTPTYNNPNAKLHVMCQEIGHTFGLGHVKGPKNKSCMNDQTGLFDAAFAHPNQHDYDQLASIYAHLDSSGTASASAQAAPLPSFDTTVIDLVDANGNGIIVFIVWADALVG